MLAGTLQKAVAPTEFQWY